MYSTHPLGCSRQTPRAPRTHATIVRSLTINCYEFLCSFKRKDKIKCTASPLRVHLKFFVRFHVIGIE